MGLAREGVRLQDGRTEAGHSSCMDCGQHKSPRALVALQGARSYEGVDIDKDNWPLVQGYGPHRGEGVGNRKMALERALNGVGTVNGDLSCCQ